MNILLTFDSGYAPHASVVMESIIRHCPEKLDFWILYVHLDTDIIRKMKEHYKDMVQSINFIYVDSEEFTPFKGVQTLSHISNPESVLLRLFCDRIPCDDWILYWDCDVLVMQDIRNLMSNIESTKILYAVTEYNAAYKENNLLDKSRLFKDKNGCLLWIYEAYVYRAFKYLNLNPYGRYFNAGVMLINMKLWRENNIGKRALEYILSSSQYCFATDQDALNHLLSDKYGELPPKWNDVVKEYGVFTNYPVESLKETHISPAIRHFAGAMKPWHYLYNEKYRRLYKSYRQNTPWPKINYTDKTIWTITKKHIKLLVKGIFKPILSIRFMKQIYSRVCMDKAGNLFWSTARLLNE